MGNVSANWAHIYHKIVAPRDIAVAEKDRALVFVKQDVPMFSQLLLSWNAQRPEKGHFAFFVRAHNVHTKEWGAWHRMIEWGNEKQRSFESKSDGFTKYVHVRLETEPLQLADGFCIKVVGAKGASFSRMKSLSVTVANLRTFVSENHAHVAKKCTTARIENVPKISQISIDHVDSKRICSPVSCTMLSEYVTKRKGCPVTFAINSFDKGLDSYGSWPFNIAHLYEQADGSIRCYSTRLNSFKDIHTHLMKGIPVVVSVRGSIPKAPQPYRYGHLLIVIGYDASTQDVLCHDPAKEGHHNVEQRYALKDFLQAWEASHRLAYMVEPL